ncbi:MAG TPA: VOC family protein [Kofleriaceae bacterium]|jgi:hypothetical protein|nr:VOC family protein [Kofleriaceae bacterium]
MLELDHVYCFVDPARDRAARIAEGSWRLDDGIEHPGQRTRNRRLCFAKQFVEFLWISSRRDAETSPLRLDRRADWRLSVRHLPARRPRRSRRVLAVRPAVRARPHDVDPPRGRGAAGGVRNETRWPPPRRAFARPGAFPYGVG